MKTAYVSGGWESDWQKKKDSCDSFRNRRKTSLRRWQKKKKGLEILRHSRNLQKRRKCHKKQSFLDRPMAVQKNKRTLTAAGEPLGNVKIHWENEGSPRFSLIAQPQALRAILGILRHNANLQKRRKRHNKQPCPDRLRTVQKKRTRAAAGEPLGKLQFQWKLMVMVGP